MASHVVPIPKLQLANKTSLETAEQKYWKSFKNPKSHTTTASWSVTHISFPATAASLGVSASAVATPTTAAATKQNDLFAVTAGPRVDLYSIRKRDLLKTIGRFDSVARSGEIRPDGRVLVAGEDSGKMQLFNVAGEGRPAILKTWNTHKQATWVTQWSPTDLTTLMSTSDDKTVRLWDLTGDHPVQTFTGHQDYVRAGAFLPGATGGGHGHHMLVTGSYDSTVRLWDARVAGGAVLTFKHAAPVEAVLPMPSGSTILAASDNTVSVLDVVAARPLKLMANHQKTVTSLCLASHGERVLSGGLDGHVKVYETNTWNVVASTKYASPVLSVAVIAAGASGDDRHLAVGMVSGVLNLRTRLTGRAAQRETERKRERAARAAGKLVQYDAKKEKRKRLEQLQKLEDAGFDLATSRDGETAFTIDPLSDLQGSAIKRSKEQKWQRAARKGNYAQALDEVLDPDSRDFGPVTTLTLLTALRHRSALRTALEGRNEETVQPILKWVSRHIVDPRFASVCIDVGLHLFDLYGKYVAASPELDLCFHELWQKVRHEVTQAETATQMCGMVETIMHGSL